MQREEKSERSRRAVLDASLYLFAQHGYRATTMRDIAERSRLSTGNVYHHFPDKEAIFRALIDEYFELTNTERFPFRRALTGTFPDNLEELGYAARDSIRMYRQYHLLIHVDVIEFGGTHVQQFYNEMSERYSRFIEERGALDDLRSRLRPEVSPTFALLLTTRLFFNYFTLEIIFGVQAPFGQEVNEVVPQIADIIRNGVCAK